MRSRREMGEKMGQTKETNRKKSLELFRRKWIFVWARWMWWSQWKRRISSFCHVSIRISGWPEKNQTNGNRWLRAFPVLPRLRYDGKFQSFLHPRSFFSFFQVVPKWQCDLQLLKRGYLDWWPILEKSPNRHRIQGSPCVQFLVRTTQLSFSDCPLTGALRGASRPGETHPRGHRRWLSHATLTDESWDLQSS